MPALGDGGKGCGMTRSGERPTYDELAALVAQLPAEIRALRAEVAARRGDDGATVTAEPGVASASPARRKRPPSWAKANVVVVARHRPR